MGELAAAAFVLGLVGSPHCVGMCGPFALACGGRPGHLTAWHMGKLGTYATLGSVAAVAGAAVPGPLWLPALISGYLIAAYALSSLDLLPDVAPRIPGVEWLALRAGSLSGWSGRLAFGAANGLLPCGMVYAALAIAALAGGPLGGAVVMLAFGLGTVPLVTAFTATAHRTVARRPVAHRALVVLTSLAGVWVVTRRAGIPIPLP